MDIEKFIKENKESFDLASPSNNHFADFNKKMDKRFRKRAKLKLSFFLRIAAVFVLGIMSTLWLYEKFSANNNQQFDSLISLSQVSEDYAEVEYYFTSSIDNNLNELKTLTGENTKLENELLLNELNQLDSLYFDLQKELAETPDNDEIINAMITHYQTKMKIISLVVKQLKKVKTLKKQKHEKLEM